MRSARFAFVFCLFLCAIPAWPQQTSTQSTPPPTVKDPQAVSIVKQALAGVGGIPAVLAITDYTASGTIIYRQNPEVQGSVTLRGLGLNEFREEETLPTDLMGFLYHGE